MSYANDPATRRSPDLTLEYGHAEPAAARWWNYTRADVQARIDGILEFLGMALAMVGGGRRVAFALALMLLAGGLGDCLPLGNVTDGPTFMAVGGGILGFLLPLPKR
jgi:hypothetical protein